MEPTKEAAASFVVAAEGRRLATSRAYIVAPQTIPAWRLIKIGRSTVSRLVGRMFAMHILAVERECVLCGLGYSLLCVSLSYFLSVTTFGDALVDHLM